VGFYAPEQKGCRDPYATSMAPPNGCPLPKKKRISYRSEIWITADGSRRKNLAAWSDHYYPLLLLSIPFRRRIATLLRALKNPRLIVSSKPRSELGQLMDGLVFILRGSAWCPLAFCLVGEYNHRRLNGEVNDIRGGGWHALSG